MSVLRAGFRIAGAIGIAMLFLPFQVISVACGSRLAQRIPVLIHRNLLRIIGVRVITRGQAPGKVPALVVSNHVSWLDILVIGSLQPLSFIAKAEVAQWPALGRLAKLHGTIFIDRQRRTATVEVNDIISRRLADGEAIVLFPEGTTGDGNRMLPFRSSLIGAAQAALTRENTGGNQIELRPLAVSYIRRNGLPVTRRERPEIAWYGDMELAPHLWALLREGPLDVAVQWGEPIMLDTTNDRKSATLRAQAIIRQSLRQAG